MAPHLVIGAPMTANEVAEWAGAVGAWVLVIGFAAFLVAVIRSVGKDAQS